MKNILTSFIPRVAYGERIRPRRDWLVLLALAFLILVGSAGWNFWIFSLVENGAALAKVPAPAGGAPSTVGLDTIEQVLSGRAVEEVNYTGGAYDFIDPSQ